MKMFAVLVIALVAMGGSVVAQERTASDSVDTQQTWSTLSHQIGTIRTQSIAINSRLDQNTLCTKKGLVYAPGVTGADTQGCIEAYQKGAATMNVTNLDNSVDAATGKVNQMLVCAKSGQVFNGTQCVAPTVNAATCRLDVVEDKGAGGGHSAGVVTHVGTCPSGYTLLSSSQRQSGGSCTQCYQVTVTDVICGKVICE